MTRMRARATGNRDAEAIADRWHSLAIHLLRRLRREDTKAGLTGPRLSALSVVVFAGPVTLGELAAAEQVKPPTMTRIVRALEREHLVRRQKDGKDGRVVRLRATPKGEALLHAGRARRVAMLSAPIAELDATHRDTLRRAADILSRVIARLS